MATIVVTKEPNILNAAYGPNIISITDTDTPAISTRFIAQIREPDYTTVVSDVRQLPNLSGYVHFDVQNILKNQVTHNPNIETTPRLTIGNDEVFVYTLAVGYDDAGVLNLTGIYPTAGEFIVTNARKPFNEIDWQYSDYVATLDSSSLGGFSVLEVESKIKALTDRHIVSKLGSEITDGKPTGLANDETCWIMDRGTDDHYTLSFFQKWTDTGNGAPTFYNGIDYFDMFVYEGNTELAEVNLANTVANGGGPDAGTDLQGASNIVSVQVGGISPLLALYPTATHIYVRASVLSTVFGTTKLDLSDWYRFDIDNGQCNDFDHIQVSWVNSFGMRDYYTFEKRNDYNITSQQDTYKQLNADWSGVNYTIEGNSRGERVFNKSIVENYTANTRFLSDVESEYLKNLYISPDIKVRFAGEDTWVPVILTDTQYTERTFRKDKLFQHTINFRLANPQQIQRG